MRNGSFKLIAYVTIRPCGRGETSDECSVGSKQQPVVSSNGVRQWFGLASRLEAIGDVAAGSSYDRAIRSMPVYVTRDVAGSGKRNKPMRFLQV